VLNAYKTYQRRLRFCVIPYIFPLSLRKGKEILLDYQCEIPRDPQKSAETFLFSFYFYFLTEKGKDFLPDYPYEIPRNPQKLSFFLLVFLFSLKKATWRGRGDTQGYTGIRRERWRVCLLSFISYLFNLPLMGMLAKKDLADAPSVFLSAFPLTP